MLFADPRWRRELASWMHPRRRREGIVAAPATRFVVSHFDVGERIAGKDAELARRSPVLAVLATDGDTAADWLAAGQALQRVLLTATAAGLQASHLNQPIQVEALRPPVAELLGDTSVPQVVLRVGHPSDDLPAAPRRSLEAVLDP